MLQKRQVGDVMIYSFVEIEAWKVIQNIIPSATSENIKDISWLQPYYAHSDGSLKAVVQSFLIVTPWHTILVDACVWNDKIRQETTERNQLQTHFLDQLNKVCPLDKIDIVLCTHLHFDHVWRNTKLVNGERVPTFSSATYYFSQKEYDYWKTFPEKEIKDDHDGFKDSVQPIMDAWLAKLVQSNHKICDEVFLVSTPWHTPDHVSVGIESKWQKAFITWDVIHHPCQITKPDRYTLASLIEKQQSKLVKKYLKSVQIKIYWWYDHILVSHVGDIFVSTIIFWSLHLNQYKFLGLYYRFCFLKRSHKS